MQPQPHIIIIGAGMAGLAAANKLISNNYQVTILEARDRIGGRTFTDYSAGVAFDVGAFIIHGTENNPITKLAHQFNANYALIDHPSYFINLKEQLSDAQAKLIQQQFNALLHAASEYATQAQHDISLAQALNTLKNDSKYAALTTEIYAYKASFLTLYSAMDPEYLSARNWDRDELPLAGGNHLMLNGYQPIVNGLAQGLSIQLNHKVHAIHYDKAGVNVDTSNGNYHADAVLVTLPLGILKKGDVKFDPPLPQTKVRAINNLGMGVLNKYLLKFPEVFWPAQQPTISWLAPEYPDFSRIINGNYFFKQPVLILGVGGNTACQFEKMGNDAVYQKIMSLCHDLFGNNIPDPSAVKATQWHQDSFSYGSYSYIPVGASGADYDELAETVGRVFFAGEATNKFFPGTVHGAYLSGLREAENILQAL